MACEQVRDAYQEALSYFEANPESEEALNRFLNAKASYEVGNRATCITRR